jgi:aryl-alcohol dehydrogenase-like predicted oxidoreductase
MQQRTIDTDLSVSASGLGRVSMTAGYCRPDPAERVDMLRATVDRGVTVVDTADIYGPHADDGLVGALGLRGHLTMAHETARTLQIRPFPRVR